MDIQHNMDGIDCRDIIQYSIVFGGDPQKSIDEANGIILDDVRLY